MGVGHQRPKVLKKLRKSLFIGFEAAVLILLYWTLSSKSQLPFNKYPTAPVPSKSKHVSQDSSTTHPDVPQRHDTSLLAVKGTKTLVVSAYLEHRTDKKQVRVIAVVLRSEKVSYCCLFCCQDNLLYISEGVSSIHSDHFGFAYGTADIMCPIPSGCEKPTYINLTSAAANTAGTKDNCGMESRKGAHINRDDLRETFLEVKNQQVKTDSFPYNFTVCISTMYDFTNVLQLVQSLEMLQLLGVNRVVIYKTSCSPETQRILDYYTHKGLVEVIPWSVSKFVKVSRGWRPADSPGDLHYFGQIPALNDCLYRHMYQSRYVALHDTDQLILPQTVNSWVELLPQLEKNYDAPCFIFENNVFPTTVMLPPPASQTLPPQGHWEKVSGVNILAHLYQEPITEETQHGEFKIIVNPRAVFAVTVHGILDSYDSCPWTDRRIARLYHTRAPQQPKLTSDKLIYDGRLLSYSARFTPAVNKVLRQTGFLPQDDTH